MTLEAPALPLIVIPDAGPLITLAYANSLDLLQATDADVWIVDMVEFEVTRNVTSSSERIGRWIRSHASKVVQTDIYRRYSKQLASSELPPRKANLGELAAQEVMNSLAVTAPSRRAVFLFEDHKIARTGFVLPDHCMKVSTRAWLRFLERSGCIASAWQVERLAVENGRAFSALRFPSDDKTGEPAADYVSGKSAASVRSAISSAAPPTPTHRGTAMNTSKVNPVSASRRGPTTVPILRLVVTLEDVQPTVSRTLLIRATSPLSTLHAAIQQAMPWEDSHLHEFEKDGVRYGPDWFVDQEPGLELQSERIQLGTLFRKGTQTLQYLYDFGDCWRHTVTLDATLPPDLSLSGPSCVSGENRCPPEDVGGPKGYEQLLAILSDPSDDEHEHMKQWAGGDIDPNHFDLDAAEQRMSAWFPKRRRTRSIGSAIGVSTSTRTPRRSLS